MANTPSSCCGFDQCLAITRACGDTSRLRMLLLLAGGELCLCQLTAVLDLAASTISEHLRRLREAGLIDMRQEGKWRYFRLADEDARTPSTARDFLRWVRTHAADDAWVREQAEHVHCVRCTPVEEIASRAH